MRKKRAVLILIILHLVTVLAKSPLVENIKVNVKDSVNIVQTNVEEDCSVNLLGFGADSRSCSEDKSGEILLFNDCVVTVINSIMFVKSWRTRFLGIM